MTHTPSEGSRRGRVCLLHEPEEGNPFGEVLGAVGFEVVNLPVLEYEYTHVKELREALQRPESYSGLILTSPRAVVALAEQLRWLPSETGSWHTRRIFAVGPRTSGALEALGFSPEGASSGSGEQLAQYIVSQDIELPLLFLCGNRRRDTVPENLQRAGVAFEELCVYETHLRSDIDLAAVRSANWVVFFSPSGVEAVGAAQLHPDERPRVAAIGDATAEALREAGFDVDAVASHPSPDALATALVHAESPRVNP